MSLAPGGRDRGRPAPALSYEEKPGTCQIQVSCQGFCIDRWITKT